MIRLGVIGCGVVASYGHLPAIKATPGLELHAVMDTDWAQALSAQKRFGAPHAFTDIDAFFASGLDAVVICSPAPVHYRNIMQCARFAKPALCEKPLAMSEAEAAEMIDTMRAAGLPLYVGFTYRFSPVALDIQRLVKEGAIGQPRSLRLLYVWDCHGKYNERGKPESGLYDRRVGRMLEGGPMVDCGVHQIDLARWWTGSEVARVGGRGAWVETEGYAAPDHLWLHMDHQSGAHTTVEISFTYGHTAIEPRCEFEYELIGTDGLIRYNRQGRYFECVTRTGVQYLNWTEEKNFEGMYREFERALRTGIPGDMPTAADGLAATRLARLATEDAIGWRKAE
jgi:predicted dehydrogenase